MKAALALFGRDLRLAARGGGAGGLALVFFLCVVASVPFGLGPDRPLLARIGPAILWIGALLATLIGLDRLFGADEEDGSLDLLRLSATPTELFVLAKVAAHWVTTGLPLVVATPLYGLLLAIEPDRAFATALSLLLGTPALTFLGAVGAAVTAGLRRGGPLLAILILPLAVPILILGAAATDGDGAVANAALVGLAGLTLAAGAVGTLAAAAAIRSPE